MKIHPHSIDLEVQIPVEKIKNLYGDVGLILIDYFFETAVKNIAKSWKRRFITGYMSCMTDTELMDEDLLDFDLSVSDEPTCVLVWETIAFSKMTDVPEVQGDSSSDVPTRQKIYSYGVSVVSSSMVPCAAYIFVEGWRG